MIAGRLLRTRARRLTALVLTMLVIAAVAVAVWPRQGPAPVAEHDERITVPGGPGVSGTVTLDAGLYLPATLPAPAVIVAHGFGGSRASVTGDAERLARNGFVVLTYSARGFGASTGRIGLDSVDYEVADARALVDWLSHRSEVRQDAPGDPRVGVTGGSYGGALSLMLAGTDPRVDAVAAIATWNDLTQALFPNNGAVTGAVGSGADGADAASAAAGPTPADIPARPDGVFKRSWTAALMTSVLTGSSIEAGSSANVGGGASGDAGNDAGSGSGDGTAGDGSGSGDRTAGDGSGSGDGTAGDGTGSPADAAAGCSRMMLQLCQAYVQVAQTGRLTPAMEKLLANSSPARVAGAITAPTLLVQGENDTLFGLDQADANARAIAGNGTPVAVSWYAGGHDGGGLDGATQDRVTGWLQHYLSDTGPVPSTAFRYTVSGPPSDSGRARTRTLEVPAYPGLGGGRTARVEVPLAGRAQTAINPPGGLPAAVSSLPGLGSLGSSALGALSALPGQTAVFSSQPVSTTTVVTGSATVTLSVAAQPVPGAPGGDGSAVLFVSLAAAGGSAGGVGAAIAAAGAGASSTGATAGAADSSATGGGSAGDGSAGDGSAVGDAAIGSAGGPAGGAVAPLRITGLPADGSPAEVTVHLPAVAFQLQPGQSLQVRVGTTDQAYAGPTAPAVYRISLAGDGMLSVPEVDGARVSGGDEPVGVLVGLIVLVVVAVAALALAGRVPRRRREAVNGVVTDITATGAEAGTAMTVTDGAVPDGTVTDGTVNDGTVNDRTLTDRTATEGNLTRGDDFADEPPPLVIRGLRKAYPGGVVAVDDVSLEVRRGEVLGLLGPNGAGKTTTLRMVMGLISPTAGDITLFGSPIRPGAEVLSRVGSFVEGSGFLPHLSGRSNLDLYWRATGRPAADAHLEQALDIAGLGSAVNRRVKTYSQGMRQRLAIAQAMLGLPDLLLLDEPTNGLDPPQIHAMREVLRRYAATGRTVLISSHLLSEVEQTCSHVVIVHRGRTIAAGSVAEMVSASGEMLFSVTDSVAARSVLESLDGIGEVEVTANGVQADLAAVALSTALRALLDGGITVTAAAPRNRLEDVFLDLVGAGTPAAR